MRTFVHLLLFLSAIAIAVGAFGPLIDSIDARDVRFDDLRGGFAVDRTIDQISGTAAPITSSLAIVVFVIAALVLLAALFGSKVLGWLGVLAGLALIGVLTWRLDERFDDRLRNDYRHLLDGAWGLYLIGGGVLVALISLLVPRERA